MAGNAPLCSVTLLPNQLLTYHFHFYHAHIVFKIKLTKQLTTGTDVIFCKL